MSAQLRRAAWALLAGNAAIGSGVFVAAGSLNDLARSLQVSVASAGQLVSIAAVVMGLGAPLLAFALGGFDRRRLLVAALLWYAAGHALSALASDYAALAPLRAATVLAAAVFTPQAAAAIGALSPPPERGRAITFVFVGWSVASVLGMPLTAWIAESAGWRWSFGAVALLAAGTAFWVWRALPDGLRPAPMRLSQWSRTLKDPRLMGLVAITAASGAGQFTLLTYFAPYQRQVLGAGPEGVSLLFFWFGLWGLLGNMLMSRVIDRLGAPRCVTLASMAMALSLGTWPLAHSPWIMAAVILPWGLGCFSANSGQQARLAAAAPASAPALMAMNTSAIYVGQGLGAAGGGAMAAAAGLTALWPLALAWMSLAVLLSWRFAQRGS